MYYAPLGGRARNRKLERFSTEDLNHFDGVHRSLDFGYTIVDDTAPEKSRELMVDNESISEIRESLPEVGTLFRHLRRVTTGEHLPLPLMRELHKADLYSSGKFRFGITTRIHEGLSELQELAYMGNIESMKVRIGRYGLRGVHEDVNITIGATTKSRVMPGSLEVFVAPLAGLAIVEQNAMRGGIEPVILGPKDTPGLFPKGLTPLPVVVDPAFRFTHQQ